MNEYSLAKVQLFIITKNLCYYCMLSQFYFSQSQYSEQPFTMR